MIILASFWKYLHIPHYIAWNIQAADWNIFTYLRVEVFLKRWLLKLMSLLSTLLIYQQTPLSGAFGVSGLRRNEQGIGFVRKVIEKVVKKIVPLWARGQNRVSREHWREKFLNRAWPTEIGGPQQGDSVGQMSISYPWGWDSEETRENSLGFQTDSVTGASNVTYPWGRDCCTCPCWQGFHCLNHLRVNREMRRQKVQCS